MKKKDDKEYLKARLSELVKRLCPKTIIVYGAAPDDIFKQYKDMGIHIGTSQMNFEVCQILIRINKEKRIFYLSRIKARIKSENILKQCTKHKD